MGFDLTRNCRVLNIHTHDEDEDEDEDEDGEVGGFMELTLGVADESWQVSMPQECPLGTKHVERWRRMDIR